MAGHARYTVLLDANVLYPMAVCDALMEVAFTGIYAAKWSARIDDEWIRNRAHNKGIPEARLHTRRDLMHQVCPDWEVPASAWMSLEAGLHPDEFLLQQLTLEPLVVLPAFKSMRARLQNPHYTPEAFANSLEKNGLVQTAAFLRQALPLI